MSRLSFLPILVVGLLPACFAEFEVQPYELPDDQGYRHITAMIHDTELIIFGGLGNGGPFPPTPMNHDVYTLDLEQSPDEQQWEKRSTDHEVVSPWFTSTKGFVEVAGNHYLACDDTNDDTVYSFDPETYQFSHLSSSTLDLEFRAGDCCAVGLRVPVDRCDEQDDDAHHNNGMSDDIGYDDRIYIVGGRNDFEGHNPTATVRYYSVTHDRWEQVADLNTPRSHLGCASATRGGRSKIYAIAGGNSPMGVAMRSIEVYDVMNDEWTLREDFLPDGRTRVGVVNINNKFLGVIGGDSTCAGGGGANCGPDDPLTAFDLIDIRHRVKLVSRDRFQLPQLQFPRQTPGTALRTGRNFFDLYVIGGRTRDADGVQGVLTTTERLTVHPHPHMVHPHPHL